MSLIVALDILNCVLQFVYYGLFVIFFADLFLGLFVCIVTASLALMGLRELEDVFPPDNPGNHA